LRWSGRRNLVGLHREQDVSRRRRRDAGRTDADARADARADASADASADARADADADADADAHLLRHSRRSGKRDAERDDHGVWPRRQRERERAELHGDRRKDGWILR
jgi:hypothetical protein